MANLHEQFIVDESGKKKAVILPIEDYEELLEDIHDLAVIAERKDEPTASFDEIKNEKTDKLSLTVFAMIAPKGRNTTAQGSALCYSILAHSGLVETRVWW